MFSSQPRCKASERMGGTYSSSFASAFLFLLLLGSSVAQARKPNLVIILVDTLRQDFLECYGFQGAISPGLGRLAGDSILFTRAVAQAPWTKPSVATFFTSLYPERHG